MSIINGQSNESDQSFGLASSLEVVATKSQQEILDLGPSAFLWNGDDLPRNVGSPPSGYVTKTFMTQWRRGVDQPGYMSFGPYFETGGSVGSIFKIRWIMSIDNRGGPEEDVLTVDCVDFKAGGRDLFPPTTFKVKQFPVNSDGFIVFSRREVELKAGMSIETRVFARGGASLSLYQLRYDATFL
ncbi:MAG: hypothetical protein ACK55R_06825 [Cyanobacteriota bacterium]|jgi:hypothetical protein